MSLAGSVGESGAQAAFITLVVSIPLLTVLALLSGAWLTWGRPRAA